MAAIAGKTGTVDGACNEVKSWSVTINTDMLPATNFCSNGWRKFVEGLKGATGSLESTERYSGSSSITLGNTEGGASIAGNVLWHEEVIENDVEGLMTYSQGFTFDGEVTVT
ncbi:MAG: hypothetical protein ACOCUV_00635 [bacterium]